MRKDFGAKTFLFPMPVMLVATYDEAGVPNAMPVGWGGICNGHPPLLEISISTHHKTAENIKETGAFTVAIAEERHMKAVDYFGMVSGHKGNKIEKAGYHVTKSALVNAPLIEEFAVHLECEAIETREENGESLIIAKIVNVSAEESVLDENGNIDEGKVQPLSYDPIIRSYRKVSDVVGKAFSVGKELKLL